MSAAQCRVSAAKGNDLEQHLPIDVEGLEVLLASIFVAEQRAAKWPFARH